MADPYAQLGMTDDDQRDIAAARDLVDGVNQRLRSAGSPLTWVVMSGMAPPESWPARTMVTET